MGYNEKTIVLLQEILIQNYLDQNFYLSVADNTQKLKLRNFFRKASQLKRSLFRRIKYEIEVLENEIELLGGNLKVTQKWKEPLKDTFSVKTFFHVQQNALKQCFLKENKNVRRYNKLLSLISDGRIREMLLFQKHSIQLMVTEMELNLEDGEDEEKQKYF